MSFDQGTASAIHLCPCFQQQLQGLQLATPCRLVERRVARFVQGSRVAWRLEQLLQGVRVLREKPWWLKKDKMLQAMVYSYVG